MHVERYAFVCGSGIHSPYAFQIVLIHVRVFNCSLQLVRRCRISWNYCSTFDGACFEISVISVECYVAVLERNDYELHHLKAPNI